MGRHLVVGNKKDAADAARGKVFAKLAKEIYVIAKMTGNGDVNSNPSLRTIVTKAKSAGMSADTITRAIKKATDGSDKANYEAITYEGYGPSGVAVMVRCLTDNKNRTAGNMRHIFDKCGGSLGVDGSVSYIFCEVDGEFLYDFPAIVAEDKKAAFAKFLDMLDDDDDVQEVIHNGESDEQN